MITKEIKAKYSCRRKRDFVTWFAISFFLVIVVLELYLILWVPIQLRREGVLQKHVAKEQMGTKVDYYRSLFRRIPAPTSLNKGEIALAQNMLDLYANYIRTNQDKLELSEILDVSDLLDRYGMLAVLWQKNNFAFVRNEIPLSQTLTIIENKNQL